jgi:peptide/nickel transport system substrate-binding protein
MAERLAGAAELNAETKAAKAEADPAKRNEMYADLQKKV